MRLFSMILALSLWLIAKPIVSVSIPPQAYFLKQIAQDTIIINTLVPQNSDPHTFEFKPQTIYQLQKSDLYLTIGLEFEKIWIPKLKDNLFKTKILSIANHIEFLSAHNNTHNHHNHHHKHHHSNNDPHIWLSPILAKTLAKNIAEILIEHYPNHQSLYEKNLQMFLKRIDLLHNTIQDKLKPLKNRNFLVYHPSWAYFAQAYNLREFSIQTEGKEPTPKELTSTITMIKQYKIKTIFLQDGFPMHSSQMIAKNCNIGVWITNPLAYEWENELLNFTEGLLQ